ncbi:A.superbus venom factor 1-like, partial [Odontesthes bonariensis]|uniref:A.superbus venom factor 1-like n=1 Tax=Odontesthes bonariensis TaxID=219752 RepID=UPI003F5874B8
MTMKCFGCGQLGHLARNCPDKAKPDNANPKEGTSSEQSQETPNTGNDEVPVSGEGEGADDGNGEAETVPPPETPENGGSVDFNSESETPAAAPRNFSDLMEKSFNDIIGDENAPMEPENVFKMPTKKRAYPGSKGKSKKKNPNTPVEGYDAESESDYASDCSVTCSLPTSGFSQQCYTYSFNVTRDISDRMSTLENEILNLQGDTTGNVMEKLKTKKNLLAELLGVKAQGALVRSRFQSIELMDAPTKFFFNLEKKNGQKKLMQSLQSEDGTLLHSQTDIRRRARAFFEDLYESEISYEQAPENVFLNNLPQMSSSANTILGGVITLEEVFIALQSMESGKAPGIDGLPVAFYKVFWPEVGTDLLEVLSDSLAKGWLPQSCRRAVVTLLPKKGDLNDIRSWRPVSVLCVEYKVLSKVLANRLSKVVGEVIHPDQTYCVPAYTGCRRVFCFYPEKKGDMVWFTYRVGRPPFVYSLYRDYFVGHFTLLAPDLLRTDSQENIFLQVDGLFDPITVIITIQDFTKTTALLQESVILNQGNGFNALKTIQLSSDGLNREEKKNKFVYLTVNFVGYHSEERILMVSFHSGYIFIQTDQPIYNPGKDVRFRTFVSSPFFEAVDRSITIDIQNPDGVVIKQISRSKAINSIITEIFPLSEIANEGTWSVTAKFDHWQQNTFTAKFEVKKYVLPAFNVTLTPRKSFLSLDDSELVVEISAKYLYGQPVQGTAYVVFGVMFNQQMKRLSSMKQVSDLDGGIVRLSMEEIRTAYPNIRSLVGHSVYVKASVLTSTGSDLVEAQKTGIKIVESPYAISFKDMPQYFKPGLPFDFTIHVTHHDASPAHNVKIKINLMDKPLAVSSGTIRTTLNMPNNQHAQTIIAETTETGLRPDQQARQQITVQPYTPFNNQHQNYLYISTGTNTVSVGDRLSVKISIRAADETHRKFAKHITYMVLNKGKIIKAERLNVEGLVVTSVGFMVTSEMMPSFRIVAFFSIPWTGREEVVSDSVWIDVADSCVGGLKVGPVDGRHRDYEPGKLLRLQIKGDAEAVVNLVAVDNAVYLLNKDRLTQRKIWDVVEHGDIGCTKGGGRDATSVFTDAGLLYSSSAGFKTKTRQALQCPGSARRRRSAALLNRKAQLESHYKEKLQRRCCNDGLREIPMPYSCTRRSLYITEGWECMRAFRYCCATYRGQVFDTEIPTTPAPITTTTLSPFAFLPEFEISGIKPYKDIIFSTSSFGSPRGPPGLPGFGGRFEPPIVYLRGMEEAEVLPFKDDMEEEEGEYQDKSDVYLRSKFFESWLWMDVKLPKQTDSDGLASMTLDNPLPDSITEWGILAISASPQKGFCVAEPYNVKAWKRFFVDLRLPYSVARNEQVEIKALIHSYIYDDLHIRVVLMKTEGICSVAFKDSHTKELKLPAGSSVVVPYTIMPLVVGKLPLEIMVVARDLMGGDRVQKVLRVVLDGVQKTEVWNEVLDPSSQGGSQTISVPKFVPTSIVPNSHPETIINVRGHLFADSIDNSISEDSLASLIQMPGGCVEQNLASMTLPLIATLYLDRSSSWESLGVERKIEALRYIRR